MNKKHLILIFAALMTTAIYQGLATALTEQDCRGCHGNDMSNTHHLLVQQGLYQCTDCHKLIYDNVTQSYTTQVIRDCLVCHTGQNHENCVSCHLNGTNDFNKTAFSSGVHVNINTSEGINSINNSDCWTCHYNKDMNNSTIRKCEDCHTGSGIPEAPLAPKVRAHLPAITNYSCADCHSKVIVNPGASIANVTSHYALRPIVPTTNYCDYCHGPNAYSPFQALNKNIPQFNHNDPSWGGNATCRTCHSNSKVSADPLANNDSSFHELTTELGDVFSVSANVKADCILCHISSQFVEAPNPPHDTTGLTVQDCYDCHTGSGTQPQKIHNIEAATGGGGCIICHSNTATRYYVNTGLFAMHANVNTSDGLNNVTDADCKTCHFGPFPMKSGAANYSNTYFCQDCHTASGRNPAQYNNIPDTLRKNAMPPGHAQNKCEGCHIAGNDEPRPLPPEYRYHTGGPKGTAAGKNCFSCHYRSDGADTGGATVGLREKPFNAPGEAHNCELCHSGEGSRPQLSACPDCHGGSTNPNHDVAIGGPHASESTKILSAGVTTTVNAGETATVTGTITSYYTQIARAQYRINDSTNKIIIRDWTEMDAADGKFDKSTEDVVGYIDTTGLSGSYTVLVRGMSSAATGSPAGGINHDSSKPYYPDNGVWTNAVPVGMEVNSAVFNNIWSGWVFTPGRSNANPSIAAFNNRLYAAIRGTDGQIWVRSMDTNDVWGSWSTVPAGPIIGLSISAFNGRLYMMIVASADNSIWVNSMDTSGTWSGWYRTSGASNAVPSLAAFNNRLYATVRGIDGQIRVMSMDTSDVWGSWSTVPAGPIIGLSSSLYNNKLYEMIVASADNSIWVNSLS